MSWRHATRRAYHVARTDFLVRLRSRKLLVFLAVVAYTGYLFNTGTFGLVFSAGETTLVGEPTAAMVGLNAAVGGSTILTFGGFYVMRGTLERDRRHGHAPLVSSSTTTARTYLLGKLGSNTAVGVSTAVVLAGATVVNHLAFGVGPTDPVAIVSPVVLAVVPLSVLVGGLALLFGTVGPLSGTFGRVGYFVGVIVVLSLATVRPESVHPTEISTLRKAGDVLAMTLSYSLTFESMQTAVAGFDGSAVAFGSGAPPVQTFSYGGGTLPVWFVLQRGGSVLAGGGLVLAAAAAFDRFRGSSSGSLTEGGAGGLSARLPSVSIQFGDTMEATPEETDSGDDPSPQTAGSVSLTPVETRDAGGFLRLVTAELRRLLRGHPSWWYLGAVSVALLPLVSVDGSRLLGAETAVPLAAVWPTFVWSRIGAQTARDGVLEQIRASNYPVGQLWAEWLAGCLVAVAVVGGSFAQLAVTVGPDALVGLAGAVLFPPSLALVAGLWTGTPRLFEASYLGIWYVGPLNRVVPLDFAGVTTGPSSGVVPAVFAAAGLVAVVAAARHRRVYGGLSG